MDDDFIDAEGGRVWSSLDRFVDVWEEEQRNSVHTNPRRTLSEARLLRSDKGGRRARTSLLVFNHQLLCFRLALFSELLVCLRCAPGKMKQRN